MTLTHLQRLEAEAIHILREGVAESERPVMLYSAGKDSSVLLHLARKAFHPAPPPFPLLHVDTTWKFRAMYELRDRAAAAAGMRWLGDRPHPPANNVVFVSAFPHSDFLVSIDAIAVVPLDS